jgi:amino acid transporter
MVAMGGELKRPARTSIIALLLTVIVGDITGIALAATYQNTITLGFSNAVSYAYANALPVYVLPVAPTYNFLASLLTRNILLLWAMNIGFISSSIAVLLVFFIVAPRYFLTIGFDRVFPVKFANVSDRFNTPYVAIIICAVLAAIVLPIYSYYATMLAMLTSTMGDLVGSYLVFTFASIAFPFAKRTMATYRSSSIKKSVAAVPVITIMGFLAAVSLIYLIYLMLLNPAYGANNEVSIIAVVGVAVLGPIIYYSRKYFLRTKGIDLGMVFGQIPPE